MHAFRLVTCYIKTRLLSAADLAGVTYDTWEAPLVFFFAPIYAEQTQQTQQRLIKRLIKITFHENTVLGINP